MYTRCFERETTDRYGWTVYEVINISPYGFEWYIDNELRRTGLVEDVDEDVLLLLAEGFEEVL